MGCWVNMFNQLNQLLNRFSSSLATQQNIYCDMYFHQFQAVCIESVFLWIAMIFKSKHIQTMVRNSQVEDVSLDSDQTSSSPIFIPTSNKCSTTRVYAQIIGCEESTQPWLCDKQRAKVKLRGQNFAEDKHAQLLALQMLRKKLNLSHAWFAWSPKFCCPGPAADQEAFKPAWSPSRSTWCRFVWLNGLAVFHPGLAVSMLWHAGSC